MIDRRKFAAMAAVGIAVPSWALAARKPARPAQRRADLTVSEINWSTDFGATFNRDEITEGDAVWFEAVVLNKGQAAWPNGVVIRVDFTIDGQLVAWSDTHSSGLARGNSVRLRANSGVDGSQLWGAV